MTGTCFTYIGLEIRILLLAQENVRIRGNKGPRNEEQKENEGAPTAHVLRLPSGQSPHVLDGIGCGGTKDRHDGSAQDGSNARKARRLFAADGLKVLLLKVDGGILVRGMHGHGQQGLPNKGQCWLDGSLFAVPPCEGGYSSRLLSR